MRKCIEFLNPIVRYISNFSKDVFQGDKAFLQIPKDIMLSELYSYFCIILYLYDKQDRYNINIERFYYDLGIILEDIELTESGIIDLYMFLVVNDNYVRNVRLTTFIIYKENYDIYDKNKFKKQKNYINRISKKRVYKMLLF